jgi:SM-20-related protein
MQQSSIDFAPVLEGIERQGYFIGEGFWPLDAARAMAGAVREMQAAEQFHPATVGRQQGQARRENIRSDWISWLEAADSTDNPTPPLLRAYLQQLETLREAVNERFWLGLFDFEIHAAVYPPGAHYGRHLDRFQDSDVRTLTAILYLNEDWQEADGGYLRFYPQGEALTPYQDVAPKIGTFVSFLSGDYWHEVLPAHRERLALTGWFRRRV